MRISRYKFSLPQAKVFKPGLLQSIVVLARALLDLMISQSAEVKFNVILLGNLVELSNVIN